ncbi:unnamed protein product [Meloidogyne enterolobii]|uniref:Uncharacterized protein n=2 Tax=Meloidogyne enterolobii TaxID=390850 RepID=A0A6V7VS75_MELEN|nr:unnamed protein product [Meloidogyne enterolobii]
MMNSTIFLCFIFLIVLVFLAGGQEEANSNHIYREEYETYETLQRHKIPPPQTFEFAETEFTRPSYYLSVPFRSQNKLQTIPDDIFSQLIRQHIARNRAKLLTSKNSQNGNALQLRQTPFRRWSPTNGNYKEKLRQWKAELKSRLRGLKIPEQVSPSNGSDQEGTLTKELPYYVTYNPQTNTYQISNQPPLLNTGMESEKTAKPNQQNSTSRKESHKPSTVSEKLKEPPLLIVLQKALPLDKNTQEEHKTISQNILGKQLNIPNAKQILFLDDYEESMNEDDYKENDGN